MKALNNSSIGVSQTQASSHNYDYVVEKLQYIMKNLHELLPKRTFEDEWEVMAVRVDALTRKLTETVSESFMAESLKNLEGKVYQTVLKHLKGITVSESVKDGAGL